MIKTLFSFLGIASMPDPHIDVEKMRIRRDMELIKKNIPEDEKLLQERDVFRKIEQMDEFKNASTILMYWNLKNELPTKATIDEWCKTKTILLPAVKGEKLIMKHYNKDGKMVQKTLGIWEPDLKGTYKGRLDLVIVPGIAFDVNKNRLGRGKGYYDRFFKRHKSCRIGVAFSCQLLPKVPVAKHDIPMDYIVTPVDMF